MSAINLDDYGGAEAFRWDHDYLVSFLTTGKHRIVKQPLLKNAFRNIRREDFVPRELKEFAYEDRELDIGFGEVINKPTVVAEMLSLLRPKFNGRYLEIGTGSGWVAALLSLAVGMMGEVYTVERVQFLVDIAKLNLEKYPDLQNIKVVFRDGSIGLPDYAPYDGILVSAGFEKIPESIMRQLLIGGRMVVPTLNREIKLIERISEEEFQETTYDGYFFKEIAKEVI